ncbi:hypothetical protein FC83_GL001758 [Agrilactobacillus composti DSM 18527 = JCM 14202]|uniref:MobA-like NTP transferase domain-containing protein n=1 Tax=Agrilactobacillus composti DSM 18527 = JCM 14202 TaxID=1423734 RepID=X0PN14_9LACO|nr:nucleotidyltransferase family protein [Agrilactobacillus composti]KRM30622.1 hypothetical protein FC83_GL001758 [Agrilactobacillus composti DSM 18527 = JCM 14202]GAF38291.1 CTP:molybdopterin cytidylyltransferase [Agrilactobacillus composti DSM 18527 = JCM 14202]
MKISAIVLASGLSQRMGSANKLFMTYRGETFLDKTLRLVTQLPVYERLLVIGPADLKQAHVPQGYKLLVNHNPELGQSHSVVLGTQMATGDAYIYLAIDQPDLRVSDVHPLLLLAKSDKIVYPTILTQPSNPMVFGSHFRDELLQLTGDSGGRQIRTQHPEACISVPVTPGPFEDVDTLGQYKNLIKEGSDYEY